MLQNLTNRINKLQGEKKAAKDNHRQEKETVKTLNAELKLLEESLVISQHVAQKTQEEIEYRISDIVTMALDSIFDDPYEFKIRFAIKRGKTEAELFFTKDGEEFDPLTASGGGVVDVAAFSLRIACYLLQSPKPHPTIVLDEPFRFVSSNYQIKVAELLEKLSTKLGIQFIIITHEDELKIGNVIEIGE